MNVRGAVAVITGGSSGVGLALAKQLVSLGAKGVVITGRNKDRLEKAALELTAEKGVSSTQVLGIPCDATSWDQNVELMKSANDAFERIDYVFANATGNEDHERPYDWFSKPSFSSTYSMIDSVNYTIHAAIPYLASCTSAPVTSAKDSPENGPGRDRAIIITGSEAAFIGFEVSPRYGVAKGAFNTLTFSAKAHLEALGIRINCLAPGWIDTALLTDYVAVGVLDSSDLIPMQIIIDGLLRFVNNTTLSGVVTRIPSPLCLPFDVVAQPHVKSTIKYWAPFLEKLQSAASQAE